jgi:hypothetical protein
MIFNIFDPNKDIVAGRITRVASGFWPTGLTNWSQSFFVDDFWSLTGSVGTPSFGTSFFDVRRTMYYANIFPDNTHFPNDPFFAVAYGNVNGNEGSGSFTVESASIKTSPTQAVYTQFKNMLLGTADLTGQFTMASASTTVNASDIWAIDFSAFKMKDNVDAGLIEFTLSGSSGSFVFVDDSPFTNQTLAVYEIIDSQGGGIASLPATPTYEGLGLFYPANGIVVLNAALMAQKLGLSSPGGIGFGTGGPGSGGQWIYNPGIDSTVQYTYNHKTLATSLELGNNTMKVRKSEFVPARHYFVRVMNRDFNYSNNPTFTFDGTDGVHAKGTIRWTDFITSPRTYVTTVGLYDNNNELVAVAKLSRPAIKSFDNELLIKVRLDF